LSLDPYGNLPVVRDAGRTGREEPSQSGFCLDRITVFADVLGGTDIVDRVAHV
jgi:hypothetical protein